MNSKVHPDIIQHLAISVGIDPAFSGVADSSKFGMVAVGIVDSKLRVLEAREYRGLSNTDSLLKVEELLSKLMWERGSRRVHIFVDSAFHGLIADPIIVA